MQHDRRAIGSMVARRLSAEGWNLETQGVEHMTHKGSTASAVLAALLIAVSIFISLRAAQAESHWGADYFPNVPLTTQDGKVVHFYDDLLRDKIVAIDLIYTHCQDACPLETARLAQVQKMLGDRVGKDIFFYSISIDPDHDSPSEMKAYAEKFHAGPGWLFLTGKQADIELIAKKLGLYSPNWGRDGHAPDLMIGNVPAGQWMRNAATDNPRFLALMIGDFLSNWKHQQPGTTRNYAEAQPLHLDKGQYIFATQCAACHSIGHGDKIGPDLLGVTNVRDRAWLTRIIATPDKLLNEKDPIATALFDKYKQVNMPNLRLGTADVAALISFLETQTKANAGPQDIETPLHHSEHKPLKEPIVQPAPVLPPLPGEPLSQVPMDQLPSQPPQVSFQQGLLTIVAQNSTLGDILRDVHQHTGASIDIPPNATERVATRLGPGLARDVLASLLNGSSFNYVMVGSASDPSSLASVALTMKPAGASSAPVAKTYQPPEPYSPPVQVQTVPPPAVVAPQPAPNKEAYAETTETKDNAEQDQFQGQLSVTGAPAQEGSQPNTGPKNLQQILQMLQRQQQQQPQEIRSAIPNLPN